MLELLFGNATAERVLLYLHCYERGHATQIAKTFGSALTPVQRQLAKLETAGVLVSRSEGRTKLYEWNPRYPFTKELRALLQRAYDYLPAELRERYYQLRTRPTQKVTGW
ncbi:MAG: hypothetical protein A2284_19150 [Deltaproteobacteria bacterium RIFOXYA12_FULL_61_11]|nr:MAG: hypothetical protein A2284_19150 [Deltaproteobacteria bacterium RIFOXYA12_FULL_61_11]